MNMLIIMMAYLITSASADNPEEDVPHAVLPAAHGESCRHQHTGSASVSMLRLQFTCYTLPTAYYAAVHTCTKTSKFAELAARSGTMPFLTASCHRLAIAASHCEGRIWIIV